MKNILSKSLIVVFSLLIIDPTISLVQARELSARAKAEDDNGDGVLQRNEIKSQRVKDLFDDIDCDKSDTLDGEEIYNHFRGSGVCPNQGSVAGANIPHRKKYPTGSGPFPGIIALHSSGGFSGSNMLIENFKSETWVKAGYAWYAPNFFVKHGITNDTRMDTFDKYREDIEKELAAIITLMKADPKVDSKNIFAIGFSNGGFWTSYLAGKGIVTAASSHYGVWKANFGRDWTNPYPMEYFSSKSSPLLALHGEDDSTQKITFFNEAWSQIEETPKIEKHIYDNAGHVWDCFPPSRLERICNKFDDRNREVTNDALKRTLAFFKKHSK